MPVDLARQRYLQRHIEAGLPECPAALSPWQQVLVIPAYREAASLLDRLALLPAGEGRTLVILVLNRPDSDSDAGANNLLRKAVSRMRPRGPAGATLHCLNQHSDLYLHDTDRLHGPTPASRGVGLARKIGCDIAFKWMCEGAIRSRWVCTTDADAVLPPDYFLRLAQVPENCAAACYPFWHTSGADRHCNLATALYELRLHHYVLGLEYAGSPYACHTLGSCMAIEFGAYAAVRGFPQRAGGEDFYLLNKLAKTGPVQRLDGACIELESRVSHRVPFGTGPAVARISAAQDPLAQPLFYHPACYEALHAVLQVAPQLARQEPENLPALLAATGMGRRLQEACHLTLQAMDIASAIAHCRRQGTSPAQFLRQFHQWFDAFRTLKFIHGIRDAGWATCTLADLRVLRPRLWPDADSDDIDSLRQHITSQLGWRR
ncbi:MAG: hypothetical protein H6985_11190 [Pseudomonadales bacterium]|nr:hypothetical protein [Pseudomonadales bacterium]